MDTRADVSAAIGAYAISGHYDIRPVGLYIGRPTVQITGHANYLTSDTHFWYEYCWYYVGTPNGWNLANITFDANELSGSKLSTSYLSGNWASVITITESAASMFYPAGDRGNITNVLAGPNSMVRTYTFPNMLDPDHGILGEPCSFSQSANKVADPVDVTSGRFYVTNVDLRCSGPLPIEVRRSYSSSSMASNEFGYGWLGGYPYYLVPAADFSTIRAADSDGSVVHFTRVGEGDIWLPLASDNPEVVNTTSGAGNLLSSSIVRLTGTDGSIIYQWRLADGSIRNYTVRQFPIPGYVRERPYLDQWVDNRGNSLAFVYGSDQALADYGKVKQISSSSGSSVSFTYDANGNITQAAAADGRTVVYNYTSYYGLSDLTGVQFPDGSAVSYQYDSTSNLLIKETKPNGRVLQNTYDDSSRVVRQKAPVNAVNLTELVTTATFDYSVPGQTTVKDAYDRPTVYRYTGSLLTNITDPLGHAIERTWYQATDPASGAYLHSLQSETDPRGLVTTYRYDAQGNRVQTAITGDLDGDSTTQETATATAACDTLNRLTSTTDSSGITSEFSYTDANYPYLPTQIVTSKNGTTLRADRLEYTAQLDAVNPTTLFSKGLLARKTVAFGTPEQSVTEYAYNSAGLVTQQTVYTNTTDPNVVTNFAYNARGELTSTTDGDGRSTAYTYDGMSRPLTKTVKDEDGNPLGIWTTFYTGNGEPYRVIGPRTEPADSVQRTIDGAGRVVQEFVARSEARADGSGVETATPATTSFEHDFFGNLINVTDSRGNSTAFDYDAIGQVLAKKAFSGTVTTGTPLRTESFQYEPGGSVSQYTNPLGGITRKYYTANGKLRRQENPDSSILEWRYYLDGRVQKEMRANGSYWETSYDDVARITTRVLKKFDGTSLASEIREFDRRGNLTRQTDTEGYVSSKTYDGLNRVKSVTGPGAVPGSGQQVVTTIYGASGKTLTTSNALVEATVVTSDALGWPVTTQVKSSSGTVIRTTNYAYSADHNAVTVTEGTGAGAISRTIYTDTAGRLVLAVSGDGQFTRTVYDAKGNLVSTTDPLNRTTSYSFNALDQAISQTLPDTTVTNFTYDAAGNLLTRAMAAGTLTHEQTYDNAGRKLTERLYSGGTNTRQFGYSYYPSGSPWAGLLQTVTAPRDMITTTYDDFARPQSVATAGSLAETNGTTTYAYDRRGLAISISQSSVGDAAGPATQVNRTYDGYGQLLAEAVAIAGTTVSSVTQTWDAAGRRASLNEAGSTLPAPLFGYQHRADGLLAQVAANNQNYGFSYADSGMLTTRTNLFRAASIDARDAAGRILGQTTAVGAASAMVETMSWRADSTLNTYAVTRIGADAWNEARAYSYNSRGQLVSEGFAPAVGASASLTYLFDGNNPGLGVRTDAKVGSGAPLSWESRAAATDALARVTQDQINVGGRIVPASGVALGADHVDISVDGVAQGRARHQGWADPVGAWSIDLNLLPGSHTLTANAVHPSGQYTATASSTFTVASGGSGQAGNVVSSYDADGNVTNRTWDSGLLQTLTWDAFGRLIKVAQRDGASNGYDWTAVYDPLGRRLTTTQQALVNNAASGTAVVTTSIYDPQVEFLEIGVAVNGVKAWKVFGPDLNGRFGGLQGTGGLEAVILDADGTTTGVINDQFGNGVATVSGTGSGATVTWNSTRVGAYGPLPGIEAQTLTDVTQLAAATAWRGHRIDPTGFYWLGARYYEPTSGRFLSADPMGHAASPSLYDYAGGDPANGSDPDGRCAKQQAIDNTPSRGDDYDSIVNSIYAEIARDPSKPIYLSYHDMGAIFQRDAETARDFGWDRMFITKFMDALQGATGDGTFHYWGSTKFVIDGQSSSGGDINYSYQGMASAAHGWDSADYSFIYLHNKIVRPYDLGKPARSEQSLGDCMYWATVGYDYYKISNGRK